MLMHIYADLMFFLRYELEPASQVYQKQLTSYFKISGPCSVQLTILLNLTWIYNANKEGKKNVNIPRKLQNAKERNIEYRHNRPREPQ